MSPVQGVAAMAKSDVVSWGVLGFVYGAIVGALAHGGILSSIENGAVIGVLWAIFGLVAGALYGLWAGRAVSTRRLKGVGTLLPPDCSMILAWTDGATDLPTMQTLAMRATSRLDLHFVPIGRGVVPEG